MRNCDTQFTVGGCDGHYGGKFEDCLAEAVYLLSLEGFADDQTGSDDYEGHVSLLLLETSHGMDMDGNGKRLALIPPGNYIVFTSTTGGVTLSTRETKDEAVAEFEVWQERYEMWDSQDDY